MLSSGIYGLVCIQIIEINDCSSVSYRSLVSFGPAAGAVLDLSESLATYINYLLSSLGYTLPCQAGLLMDNIQLLVGSY